MDTYSHVNNAVHYELMTPLSNGWLVRGDRHRHPGLGAVGWVVERRCRYLAPLQFPTVVDVGIALERLGARASLSSGPVRRRSGPVAVARFVHVYVDRNDHSPHQYRRWFGVPRDARSRSGQKRLSVPRCEGDLRFV